MKSSMHSAVSLGVQMLLSWCSWLNALWQARGCDCREGKSEYAPLVCVDLQMVDRIPDGCDCWRIFCWLCNGHQKFLLAVWGSSKFLCKSHQTVGWLCDSWYIFCWLCDSEFLLAVGAWKTSGVWGVLECIALGDWGVLVVWHWETGEFRFSGLRRVGSSGCVALGDWGVLVVWPCESGKFWLCGIGRLGSSGCLALGDWGDLVVWYYRHACLATLLMWTCECDLCVWPWETGEIWLSGTTDMHALPPYWCEPVSVIFVCGLGRLGRSGCLVLQTCMPCHLTDVNLWVWSLCVALGDWGDLVVWYYRHACLATLLMWTCECDLCVWPWETGEIWLCGTTDMHALPPYWCEPVSVIFVCGLGRLGRSGCVVLQTCMPCHLTDVNLWVWSLCVALGRSGCVVLQTWCLDLTDVNLWVWSLCVAWGDWGDWYYRHVPCHLTDVNLWVWSLCVALGDWGDLVVWYYRHACLATLLMWTCECDLCVWPGETGEIWLFGTTDMRALPPYWCEPVSVIFVCGLGRLGRSGCVVLQTCVPCHLTDVNLWVGSLCVALGDWGDLVVWYYRHACLATLLMWTCEWDLCVCSWSVTMWSCSGDFSACCRSQAMLSASRSSTMKVQLTFSLCVSLSLSLSLSPSLSVWWCDLHFLSSVSSRCVCLTLWCAWFILCKMTKQTSHKSTPMKHYFVKCRDKWNGLRLDKESIQINKNILKPPIKTQTKTHSTLQKLRRIMQRGNILFQHWPSVKDAEQQLSTDHRWKVLTDSHVLTFSEECS